MKIGKLAALNRRIFFLHCRIIRHFLIFFTLLFFSVLFSSICIFFFFFSYPLFLSIPFSSVSFLIALQYLIRCFSVPQIDICISFTISSCSFLHLYHLSVSLPLSTFFLIFLLFISPWHGTDHLPLLLLKDH